MGVLLRALEQVREFFSTQESIYERQLLLNRPWEEEFLHWSWTGEQWVLHGCLVPPPGRHRSTTRDGWCPRA
jgi:hypothetical protein